MGTRVDPPIRRTDVCNPDLRQTELILAHLRLRMDSVDPKECAACRTFIRAYLRVTANGNPANVHLAIRRTPRTDTVAIFQLIPGVGALTHASVLMTKTCTRIDHIIRESGSRLYRYEEPPKPVDPEAKRGRSIPERVETVLVSRPR